MFSSKTVFLLRLNIHILVLAVHYMCRKPVVGGFMWSKDLGTCFSSFLSRRQHRGRPAMLEEEGQEEKAG